MAQNVFPGGLGKKWTQKKCQKHSNFKHVEVEINFNFLSTYSARIFYSHISKQVNFQKTARHAAATNMWFSHVQKT